MNPKRNRSGIAGVTVIELGMSMAIGSVVVWGILALVSQTNTKLGGNSDKAAAEQNASLAAHTARLFLSQAVNIFPAAFPIVGPNLAAGQILSSYDSSDTVATPPNGTVDTLAIFSREVGPLMNAGVPVGPLFKVAGIFFERPNPNPPAGQSKRWGRLYFTESLGVQAESTNGAGLTNLAAVAISPSPTDVVINRVTHVKLTTLPGPPGPPPFPAARTANLTVTTRYFIATERTDIANWLWAWCAEPNMGPLGFAGCTKGPAYADIQVAINVGLRNNILVNDPALGFQRLNGKVYFFKPTTFAGK